MAISVTVSATNNAEIDGLLSGYEWSGTITYSFPDSPSDYASPYSGGSSEPTQAGFASAPSQMQTAINYAIGLILSYTNADIQYAGTNGADVMVAQSPAANPTSYAYYPGNYAAGGDVWFGTKYDYTQAKLGNYYFTTALHELGHAFGLKHSQEAEGPANVAVPSAHDDSEYTVMSYRSYVGASTTSGYTNEAYGYPQTYMANDILALQTMYGADYTTQSSNTVYTWSPTTGQEFINGVGQLAPGGGAGGSANRIYETVWDGGGVDTYDLSNYTTNLSINLNPGASSVFSTVQLANLGDGHYASGNVYNAYLYNGDARSYIDNATGGSGNDTIIGNVIANTLNGGSGNDTITGGGGNDTIIGGAGTDTAVYSGNRANYSISFDASTQTFTVTDLRGASPDGLDTDTGIEYLQFADGTFASSSLIPITIEAMGTTALVQSGGLYNLNPVGAGTGPTLKYQGTAYVAGQFGSWTPIGVEQIGSGYQVAWKMIGVDNYSVWSTDSNGNYISNVIGGVSGSSASLASFESAFHQDLNGDGIIGLPSKTVIESFGSTELVKVGSNFYFGDVGSGSVGPELTYKGSPFVDGQAGGWTPIGVEQTGSGYQVAWKVGAADNYSVWSTDSNGNYISNLIGGVSGSSASLVSFESGFHQDLNGDGVIGASAAPTAVIESFGSTKLVQVGSNFYLDNIGSGAGPELKYNSSPFVAGQAGGWSPIGVEQIGSGYQVAWKVDGADNYSVWSTDSNGNYISNLIGGVSGTSASLVSFESSFHQDLNGDGVIGASPAPTTGIEAFGSNKLASAKFYFGNLGNGGAGPELKHDGLPFADGPPGNLIGGVLGSSASLAALESNFHQDLNGDGVIGALHGAVLNGEQHSGFFF